MSRHGFENLLSPDQPFSTRTQRKPVVQSEFPGVGLGGGGTRSWFRFVRFLESKRTACSARSIAGFRGALRLGPQWDSADGAVAVVVDVFFKGSEACSRLRSSPSRLLGLLLYPLGVPWGRGRKESRDHHKKCRKLLFFPLRFDNYCWILLSTVYWTH